MNDAELKMSAGQTVLAPFKPADLTAFIASVPAHADIMVNVIEGGDQRDPYPVKFTFTASWKATS